MAMEEAIMNAIHHGNQCDDDKDVHVLIEISAKYFYSRITDQGDGFDPNELPDPTDEENLEKSSGRGVMLMRSFVDEVVYNESGNSVELKKKKT
jgi:serine/threonine-protein kinase RsbW